MTKNCLTVVIGIFMIIANMAKAQVPIAYYDFESNAARNTTIETSLQESISGIGTPIITSSLLTSSDGTGNGSGYGGSNTGYALGFYGFTTNNSTTSTDPHIKIGPFNCTGFASLSISMDAKRIGSRGPDNIDIYWSTDDVNYTRIVATVSIKASFESVSFTLPAGADGAASLYFKVIGYNAGTSPTASNGPLVMDNLALNASSFTASKTLLSAANHGIGLSSGGTYLPMYTGLTVNGNSITVSAASNLTFTGTLTLSNGQFSVGANTLSFQTANTPLARTSGTLTLGSSSNLVFGTDDDKGGNTFTIPASIFTSSPTVNNLTINRDNDLTWNAQGITVNGTLALTDGNLIMGASTLAFENGTTPITRATGKLNVSTTTNLSFGSNAAGFTIPSTLFTSVPSINNLTINRAGGITIGNQAFTINGTLNLASGTFNILSTDLTFQTGATPITRTSGTLTVGAASSISFGTNATSFTIPDNTFTSAPTITDLTINRAGGVTVGNQNFTITGALTLTAGVFNALNTTLTFHTGNDPLARTSGTLTLGSSGNLVFGTAGNTAGSAFEIPANVFTSAPSFNNLTVNRTNRLTWNIQDLTINGTLTLTAGDFRINALTLSFQNGTTPIARTSGAIDINSTSANISFGANAAGFTLPNSVFLAAPSLNNLTINRAGGITIGNQAFTINGTLNLTNGAFDILNTTLAFQTGATPIARTSGTLTVGTSSSITFGTNASSFTIPDNTFTAAPSMAGLTINRAGGVTLGNQSLTLSGILTLTSGAFTVGANTLTFHTSNTPISRGNGTLTLGSSSNLVFGIAGNIGGNAFTIPNSAFTTAPSLNNLTINRTNQLTLGNQSITLNGTLTLTAGAFSIANNTLILQNADVPLARTSGTLTVGASANLVFGTTGNTGGAAFTIPNSYFTASPPSFQHFTINRTNTLTLGNQDLTMDGDLNLTAGTLDNAGRAINLTNANITGTGTVTGSGSVIMTGNGGLSISGATISNLQLNHGNGFSLTGSLTITNVLTLTDGALTIGSNTLTFHTSNTPITRTSGTITGSATSNIVFGTSGNTGGNAFTIPNGTFTSSPTAFNNFTINRSNSLTLGNQAITINGTLNLTAGVFDLGSNAITFQTGATPIARTAGTLTVGTSTDMTFGTNATSFTLPNSVFTAAPSINNLTINRAGGLTIGNQAFTINGTLTLTNGAFDILNTNIVFQTAATAISRTSGTLTVGTGSSMTFGSNAALFTIPNNTFTAAPAITNLTIDRAGGVTFGNQSFTLSGTLTLTNGPLSIAANTLTFHTSNTPIARTAGTITVTSSSNLVFGTVGNTGGNAFTIPASTFTATPPSLSSFTINRTNSITLNATQGLTLAGSLNLTAGTLDNAGNAISVAGNITGTGTETGAGIITMSGSGATISGATISNLTLNNAGGFSLSGSPTITNALALSNGALSVGANTLTFHSGNTPITRTSGTITVSSSSNLVFGTNGNTGGNAFTIPANTFTATPPSFSSFTINRTNSITLNATQGLTLAGSLNLTAGTLDNAGRAISVAGNITGTGTETGTGIITMTGSGATISGATISNITLNNAGGFSLTGSPTITSALALTNGALAVGANTLTFHSGNAPISRTSGTITMASTSSLAFGTAANTGGSAFTIPASTFTSAPEFTNFSINRTNSLTLNSQNFTISGLLSITAGQLVLPASHIFTLRSTSITNTALVDVVGATGSISYGTGAAFRVERFIPQTGLGIRAYRDISPSVNTGTRRIFDTWQEGGTNGLVNGVYYGTHITGVVGGSPGIDASTGLDLTASGAQSLFSSSISLVNGSDAFAAITSTNQANDTLSALKGYRVLFRGNRLVNLYQTPQPTIMNAPAILRSTGTLITGQVTFTTTGTTANGGTNTSIRLNSASATGFTMIGNPYASPVVWDSVAANSTSIQSTYWLFDPNIGTGSYVTYNTLTGCSNIASSANKYIQPGQAVFVRNSALSPAPQVVFKETFKAPNTANLTGIYREPYKPISKINITVKKPITGRGIVTVDGTAVAYDNDFSNGIGPEDGNKITNGSENIAISSNNATMSIEGRKNPTINDTISLKIWQFTAGVSYQLEINTADLADHGLKPILLDRFTNTQTELPLKGIKSYPFVTTADTSSYNYRFKIVFKYSYLTLPINFTSVKASAFNRGVNVEWSAIESSIKQYQVQRSADGMNFTSIGTANAKGSGNGSMQQYTWHDASPLNLGYYRIQSTDLSGSIAYSNIVSVNLNKKAGISIYPNPITERNIRLQFTAMDNGEYNIVLYNLAGQMVLSNKINIGSITVSQTVQLPQTLPTGTYMLSVTKDDFRFSQQLIVE